jgi:HYR domain-containing protein/List-Bact-rpt repeat protein
MMHRVLARYRTCSVAIATVGVMVLAFASAASAHTYTASNTAEFEKAVAEANANTAVEANTIELSSGVYSPTAKITFTNKNGLTIAGSASAPGVKFNGGSVAPFPSELFEIGAGVSVALHNVTVTTGGGSGVPAINDFGALTIEGSTIAGNNGAGVDVQAGATATVRNSTLSDGLEFGMIDAGTASFFNSTVAFNNGGIDNASGTLNLTNTIVANNGVSGNCSAHATSSDHSLDSDGTCGVGTLSSQNPKLNSKLQNNGGPTSTHVLQVGSPAIDAGNTTTCLTTDQRGLARPDVASTACDIGATEYSSTPPTITVPANITTTATSPSGAVVTYTASATSSTAKVESFSCTPASGSTFKVGTTTVNCTATDSQANTSTASFTVTVEAKKFTLTATVTGEGTVTSTPAGIECGQTHTACSIQFNEGEAVKLTATPATGFSLSAWGGACSGTGACSVTMSAAESVTAAFSAVPVNTGLPVVSGTPYNGQTLKTTNGTWTGSPTSYKYQWEDCNEKGEGCSSIAGASGLEYTLTSADIGHTVRVLVVAINSGGESAPAESAATAIVTASSSGTVEGKVPFTQTLETTCTHVSFGSLLPGVATTYQATCLLTGTSTAAASQLTAEDPSAEHTGHLVQGSYFLSEPLGAEATTTETEGTPSSTGKKALTSKSTLMTFANPFSKDGATVTFFQAIKAKEGLHTGTYAKTIVLTLSTTTP